MTKTEKLRKKNEKRAEEIDNWLKYAAVELLEDYEETEESDIDLIMEVEAGEIIAMEG